ncbi:ATP-binding cassette domain-containing protein [Haliscomenobacter hydrossis]|uniref:ABC transporter related protein n=1 Tax=Haliscomenobacter hydrossis (strain ATCC 27775 / DSM 1100 / LMG 10767 / O) TaxID=760192 RepID=F4KS97_HALH1|nr:ATP-binding cassette domain-containing protein [Haliscomenobacter hydrossis]AEE53300.1 ABC transporter related protein [Haliscomenobacter hydrossis DSM 1100]
MIEIENLSKSYGQKRVLKNVNLSLASGKVYGIVGENGAGKTTLFKCIAGLETCTGTITSVYPILKNHLGFLPTNPFFLSKITGSEYLQLLCNARNVKMTKFQEKNIFELPLDQYAETYSTGMKKKLALTGILLQNNDFFILDEPFNGVDIQSNMIITAIIHELVALQKTIVISSHIFSTLNDTCDEIHLLREGVFVKRVEKADFQELDAEMKSFALGDRIERLGLR